MKKLILNSEVRFALEAVRKGSLLAKKIRQDIGHASVSKTDRSPVTIADFTVQASVVYDLHKAFPKDPLIGEEDSEILRSESGKEIFSKVCDYLKSAFPESKSDEVCQWIDRGKAEPTNRFWTLDPIDGTKGFVRGGQYAICLALIEKGIVKIGVMGCPNLENASTEKINGEGSLMIAVRGQGAWFIPLEASEFHEKNFRPLQVSKRDVPKEARVIQSVEEAHKDSKGSQDLLRRLGIQKENVLMDSQAKHAVLASGTCDLLFYLTNPANPYRFIKIWDQAPGSLIIEEAGGRITDLDGKDLDFSAGKALAKNRGVLASNGLLHNAALAALKQM